MTGVLHHNSTSSFSSVEYLNKTRGTFERTEPGQSTGFRSCSSGLMLGSIDVKRVSRQVEDSLDAFSQFNRVSVTLNFLMLPSHHRNNVTQPQI